MSSAVRARPVALALLMTALPIRGGAAASHLQREPEVHSLIASTYLDRRAIGGNDTAEVVRRVLKRQPYTSLTEVEYLELLERTVLEYPESRIAHEALSGILIGHSNEEGPAFVKGVQELKRAAELSFREGKVRYEPQLPFYLAITGDEDGLHWYAQQAFGILPEERDRHFVYLNYANALAQIESPLTDEMFKRAIETRPEGSWAPYEFYIRYLVATKQHDRILQILTPAIIDEARIMGDSFQRARCNALTSLGRDAEAKRECQKPQGSLSSMNTTVGGVAPIDAAKIDYPHNNTSDDCRAQFGCLYHPQCPGGPTCICYNALTWNLAEVALNEAGTELPGSWIATAWTSRDRAILMSTAGCNGFPGANTGCTSGCPWPGSPAECTLQKKYCCVIHAPDQFNRTHIPTNNLGYDVLERMRRVVDGQLPDPVSGYIPLNAANCSVSKCSADSFCSAAGSSFDAAPNGPVFWYANDVSKYQCSGSQKGIGAPGCAIVAEETCGNSPDGVAGTADNCYSRCARIRQWNYTDVICSNGCETFGDGRRLYPGGWVFKVPAEANPFKTPGGKWFDVTLSLQSGAASQVFVTLYRSDGSLLYDFGPMTVSNSAIAVFTYRSTLVVNGAANNLRITNAGPGTVNFFRVVSYD